jgi:PAS domain S-box-containing protein
MKTSFSESKELYRDIFETASDGMLICDLETDRVLTANPAAARMHGYKPQSFNGFRLQRLIQTNSLSFVAEFNEAIQHGGTFEALAQHVRRDDTVFDVEWRSVAIQYSGHKCALVLLRDVSKRVQSEHQAHQRASMHAHEQAMLLEISQTLTSTLELQPGLILEQLCVIIPYTHAGLFSLEDTSLVTLAMRGTEKLEQSVPLRIHLHDKHALKTLFNGHHAIHIADIWSDEQAAVFLRSLLELDSAPLLEGIQSWMWVPLAVKNRIIGGIGIAHSERDYFTPHHADLALSVANQAAITMINAELYEQAQALAVLEERQRLAQNLHDAVNQSLFSAGLIAEVLPRLWDRDQAEARRSLEDLRRLTRGAQAEMRALLAELRPSTLTDSNLSDLLILLGNAFTGRTNVPVTVKAEGEGTLPADTQVALYRICQEALNNIAKHANASEVEIELRHTTEELELLIRDNGCGFETAQQTPSGHYGLAMIHERAESIGASLSITSQPGIGTKIVIRWIEKEAV